jgi:hypothetical protein
VAPPTPPLPAEPRLLRARSRASEIQPQGSVQPAAGTPLRSGPDERSILRRPVTTRATPVAEEK